MAFRRVAELTESRSPGAPGPKINHEETKKSKEEKKKIFVFFIFLNAVICTLILLLSAREGGEELTDRNPPGDFSALIKKTVFAGVIAMAISVAADWGIVRAIYGDTFAGFAGKHIRFGPDATATTEKPKEGQPHP